MKIRKMLISCVKLDHVLYLINYSTDKKECIKYTTAYMEIFTRRKPSPILPPALIDIRLILCPVYSVHPAYLNQGGPPSLTLG